MVKTPADLLQKVRELELVSRHNCSAAMTGTFASSLPGRGLVFHESRRYVEGDDVRSIDWKMTARLMEPYVKIFLDEREREIYVALDISKSMHGGWQKQTKLEFAIETAATLIFSAHRNRDKFGLVLFAGKAIKTLKPSGGRRHLFECLKSLIEVQNYPASMLDDSDPRTAIHAIEAQRGRKFVIFMISDFIDDDVPDDLKYLRARHDVNLMRIYDPFEKSSNANLKLWGESPEKRGLNRGATFWPFKNAEIVKDHIQDACNRNRILLEDIATTDKIQNALTRMFHRKRKLLAK